MSRERDDRGREKHVSWASSCAAVESVAIHMKWQHKLDARTAPGPTGTVSQPPPPRNHLPTSHGLNPGGSRLSIVAIETLTHHAACSDGLVVEPQYEESSQHTPSGRECTAHGENERPEARYLQQKNGLTIAQKGGIATLPKLSAKLRQCDNGFRRAKMHKQYLTCLSNNGAVTVRQSPSISTRPRMPRKTMHCTSLKRRVERTPQFFSQFNIGGWEMHLRVG